MLEAPDLFSRSADRFRAQAWAGAESSAPSGQLQTGSGEGLTCPSALTTLRLKSTASQSAGCGCSAALGSSAQAPGSSCAPQASAQHILHPHQDPTWSQRDSRSLHHHLTHTRGLNGHSFQGRTAPTQEGQGLPPRVPPRHADRPRPCCGVPP